MKVVLVISSLAAGGGERVITALANYLSRIGRSVTIVTIDEADSTPFYQLHEKVKVLGLGLLNKKQNFSIPKRFFLLVRRLYKVREVLKEQNANMIISFIDKMNVLTLLSMLGENIPIIVSERIDPQEQIDAKIERHSAAFRLLRHVSYRKSYAVVVQTKSVSDYFLSYQKLNVHIIPNPNLITTKVKKTINKKVKSIIAVGRLHPQKDHETLIKAMPPVLKENPSLHLRIFGEGPLKRKLQYQIDDLGISRNITLEGVNSNIYECLDNADIFIMPSLYEGFSNSLMEALALGVPTIVSDCSGNLDIVSSHDAGVVFSKGNSSELSEKINYLVKSYTKRCFLSKKGQERAFSYSPDIIFPLWDRLLQRYLN